MVLHPPSCLGTTPKPEQRKLGKGGELKGPGIRLCMHSEWKASSKMDGNTEDDCKFFAIDVNWGPVYLMLQPWFMSERSSLTKVLPGWLLNSHSRMSGHNGVHGPHLSRVGSGLP